MPGKRGADQRTFSGNRVQRMQDVHGEFACGVVVKRRVRRQRVLDEFYTLFVGRAKARVAVNLGFVPLQSSVFARK